MCCILKQHLLRLIRMASATVSYDEAHSCLHQLQDYHIRVHVHYKTKITVVYIPKCHHQYRTTSIRDEVM